MLDDLWFWISDKLNEHEEEACDLLVTIVVHCHLDWKLASGKSKFLGVRLKLTKLKKNPHAF